MPVLIRGALALLLRDVEVGKADERGENIEKDARAQPPLAAAEGGADDAGEHAEADHVVERVDLDAEALFGVGTVLLCAGNAAVKCVKHSCKHQKEDRRKKIAARGGVDAGKTEKKREVCSNDSIIIDTDHRQTFPETTADVTIVYKIL